MSNLTSSLKTWGSSGTAHPDGYNYLEGEQPVDEWDNFVTHNLITEVKELQSLANDRVETDKGTAGNEPGSPETSHLYHDQDNDRVEVYDHGQTKWRDLLYRDGDSLTGNLDVNGNDIVDSGSKVWDSANQRVPQSRLENASLTVTAGTGLLNGGSVSLGGSITLNVDDTRYVLSDEVGRIDAQATAPSSPSDGDVWIDTS